MEGAFETDEIEMGSAQRYDLDHRIDVFDQAGAKVLVDEKDLWDGSLSGKAGEFPTTILIVNKKFAAEHPQARVLVTSRVIGYRRGDARARHEPAG